VPAEIVVPLALHVDDVGALDAAAGVGDDGVVDAAADGCGACEVGAVDAATGEAADEPATARFAVAEGLVGGAAFDDETGLHAATHSAATLAATQSGARCDRSSSLILITPFESASTRNCSVSAIPSNRRNGSVMRGGGAVQRWIGRARAG
jgi:hypothetical protein